MRAWFTQAQLLYAVVLAGMLLIPIGLGAQESTPSQVMSITEAVGLALKNNHELRAQEYGATAQQKEVGVARSYLLPRLSLEERYSLTTNPGYAFFSRLNQERITVQDFDPERLNNPDSINDFQTAVTLEQPLFVRKAWLGLSMSDRESQASQADLKRKREEIAYHVLKASFSVISAREYVGAARLGVDEAQEHARVAKLRYANGLGQYADTLRASTALTQARQRYNVAAKNLSLAQQYLGLLLARQGGIDIRDAAFALPEHDLAFYQQTARSRSDLNAAVLRSANARENILLAEAGYWPSLGVGGTYQLNDHEQPFGSEGTSWQVAAFLRWELFDGAKREYERAKARQLSEQAREAQNALQQGIDYRIFEAYANAQEAQANHELAKEALETASEGARLVRLRYTNGLASLADLLSAQSALEEARAVLVERENAMRTAQAGLSYESGAILADIDIRN